MDGLDVCLALVSLVMWSITAGISTHEFLHARVHRATAIVEFVETRPVPLALGVSCAARAVLGAMLEVELESPGPCGAVPGEAVEVCFPRGRPDLAGMECDDGTPGGALAWLVVSWVAVGAFLALVCVRCLRGGAAGTL